MGGGKYSSVTLTVSGTAVTSPCGGMKGVCIHVSTPTFKLVMKLIKSM